MTCIDDLGMCRRPHSSSPPSFRSTEVNRGPWIWSERGYSLSPMMTSFFRLGKSYLWAGLTEGRCQNSRIVNSSIPWPFPRHRRTLSGSMSGESRCRFTFFGVRIATWSNGCGSQSVVVFFIFALLEGSSTWRMRCSRAGEDVYIMALSVLKTFGRCESKETYSFNTMRFR